jgi:tetratricopeptide (TPR) repeat protein
MIFPAGLHMERNIPITRNIFGPSALTAFIFVTVILWLAYWTYKKNERLVSFGIVWFFISLLPVSNIIPINSFLAEHWIYMASVGIFMIVGLGFSKLWKKIPQNALSLHLVLVIAVIIPLFLFGRATVERNKDWHDEIAFFTSTLKYHPRNARLYLNLGNTYYEKKQIDKAIEQYQKAIDINKNYAVAYGNIGSACLNKGQVAKAEKYLKKAIGLKSNYPIAHYNLGIIYFNKRDNDKALKELNLATQQLPQLYQAHNMKALLYLRLRKPTDAMRSYETSLSIYKAQPKIEKALNLLKKSTADLSRK